MKRFPTAMLFILLHFFGEILICLGQSENYRFEHLSEQQGLSQNSVWSILQDSEGFMWFGTQDGLNKYDGYSFTILKPDPDDPENTFHHNIVNYLYEDSKGRLWATTLGGGLHQVDKISGKVTHYLFKPDNLTLWNVFGSIYEDREGQIWVGGNGGIACLNPETNDFKLYPLHEEAGVIFTLLEDSFDRFWTGGKGGIYLFDRKTGKFTPVTLDPALPQQPIAFSLFLDKKGSLWVGTENEGIFYLDDRSHPMKFTRYTPKGLVNKNFRFNAFFEDKQGYLWLNSLEGLQRVDKHSNEAMNFQANPGQPGSLSHQNIYTIYQGKDGTIWFGTDNGVNRLTAHSKGFSTYQLIPSLPAIILNDNNICTILEDHEGMIWLGSTGSEFFGNFKNGLYQFDVRNKTFKKILADAENPESLSSDFVCSLLEDNIGQVWVGTEEALHLYDRKKEAFTRFPSSNPVNYLEQDIYGKIWFGSWGTYRPGHADFLATFDPQNKTMKSYRYDPDGIKGPRDYNVWDILASKNGDIWVALSGAGISRLNQKTNQFTNFLPSSYAAPGQLNDKDVRALYEDKNGVIWAGTNQGGLHRYDSLTNTFTYYTVKDGLPSNHIVSIIGDEKGNLWLGTNNGLCRFNPETKTSRNFNISDGLPANEFRLGSVYSRNGKLMFGTVNGFVIFHPDSITENTIPPPVYITSINVMDKSIPLPTNQIELPHKENYLSFEFVGLNYNAPEKNQYAYMLEGLDANWIYSGTRRFASYTNLSPGKYTFRVKASNNDGIWNEHGTFLNLIIHPPWWQTWWAYIIYSFIGLCLLWGLRQFTVNRERMKHELKIQRLEAEKMHEIDNLKSRFFANISHEFRTPLTLILGHLDKFLARTTEENPDQLAYQMMYRNARRLQQLINHLLDLSKLEAGSMKLELEPADIVAFLKALVFSFSSHAEAKKIQYSFKHPQDQPLVYFDADKLEKIVVNLLSNAFKFTKPGGKVKVTAVLDTADNHALPDPFDKISTTAHAKMLELKVQDSGVGINPSQLERIFDRFYQADTSHTREQEGTGIGLSLVRELVEIYGGEIKVESQPEHGSCFTVRLPMLVEEHKEIDITVPSMKGDQKMISPAIEAWEELSSAEPPTTNDDPEAPLIHIIEDNADVRSFIRETLQPFYRILEAGDGVQGYKQAVNSIPDLILSDVMMPKMDGIEFCSKIKNNEKTAHVPLILLTAKASGGDKIEGLDSGADDYIIKPFQTSELKARIDNLIENRKKLREYYSRRITLEPSAMLINSVDEQFLQRIMRIVEVHMEDTSFGVEKFSREAGLSKIQLHRKLKALTNYSPGDFMRVMRLKRAAGLLANRAGTIAEVAFKVGFQEPSYFTRCFHKQYGKTPSEYMAEHNVN